MLKQIMEVLNGKSNNFTFEVFLYNNDNSDYFINCWFLL